MITIPTALDYTESGEDFATGELDGVVAGEDGLELEEVESPTFTRASKAYLSDGTEVDAGVPRFEDGKFDKAVMVEEGTTNLCTNPSFETDLTGWTHLGGGTSSRVTDQKYYGSACLKISTEVDQESDFHAFIQTEFGAWIEGNASQRWYAVANPGNYAGKTVSLSCMAKTSIADKLYLAIREYDGNNYKWRSSSYHPGDGTWKKLSLTTTLRSTVTDLQLQLVAGAGIIGDFWCDGVLFEEKPYATSFTPGTRSPETLTLPTAGVLNLQEGTVELTVIPSYNWNANLGRLASYFGCKGSAYNKSRILIYKDGNYLRCLFQNTDTTVAANIAKDISGFSNKDPLYLAATWKSGRIAFLVNGVLVGEVAATWNVTEAFTACYVGSGESGTVQANALIDELAIFDYAATDEEIEAWYEADAPIPITEHTTYLLRFDNNFAVGKGGARKSPPLDLSSVGTVKTSEISWQATEPTDTSLKVETSLSTNGGTSWGAWQEATNGGSIPGIVADMDLSNAKLKTRATLETEDTSVTPALESLSISLTGEKTSMIKITIAGNEYRLVAGSLQIENCIEERTSCSFLIDNPGVHFEKGMAVTISDDSGTVVIFAGFVDSVREWMIGNQNYIRTAINCIDYHYVADKRLAARAYQGQKAGDIVRDLVKRYLEEEGVVAGTILEDLKDYTLQEIADGEADI